MPTLSREERQLQVIQYAMESSMTEEMLATSIDVYKDLDLLTRSVFYGFRVKILGEQLDVITYPADWWQAFKERWFPAWLKAKFPPQYTRYEVQAQYPRMAIPEQGVLRVYKLENAA